MLKSYRPYASEEVVGASIRRVPLPKKQLSVQIGSQDLDFLLNLEQDPCYSYTDVANGMPALYRANLFVFLQPLLRVWFAIRVESNITGCIDVFGHRSSHQLNGCSCKCSQSAFRETLVKIPCIPHSLPSELFFYGVATRKTKC